MPENSAREECTGLSVMVSARGDIKASFSRGTSTGRSTGADGSALPLLDNGPKFRAVNEAFLPNLWAAKPGEGGGLAKASEKERKPGEGGGFPRESEKEERKPGEGGGFERVSEKEDRKLGGGGGFAKASEKEGRKPGEGGGFENASEKLDRKPGDSGGCEKASANDGPNPGDGGGFENRHEELDADANPESVVLSSTGEDALKISMRLKRPNLPRSESSSF